MSSRERLSKLIGPLVLVFIGLILLLYNFDFITVGIWDLALAILPLIAIVLAVSMLLGGGSLFFPLTLIALSAGFLLSALGWVDWDMWAVIAQFWPLLLIAIGVDILLGPRLGYVSTHEESLNQPLEGAISAEIKIDVGVGRFTMDTATSAELLYLASATLTQSEHIKHNPKHQGNRIKSKIQLAVRWYFPFTGAWTSSRGWHVSLNPNTATRLKIDGGVGVRTLELRDAMLEHLALDGGLGATRITLPAHGVFTAKIDGGIGDTTVDIPDTLAVRMKIDSGLGNRQIRGDFIQDGNRYLSPNYDSAEHRVELHVDHGIGSMTVQIIE